MKPLHFLGLALSAAVAFAWPMAGALAQTEPIILKVEHMMPERSTANLHVVTPWCENIEAASGGRLKCEIYPSMQLGGKPAQLPTLLRNGVIDVIWTAYGYSAGAFPRSEVLELPFLIPQDMHLANQTRGLTRIQSLVIIARKLARLAFALLKSGQEYQPNLHREAGATT